MVDTFGCPFVEASLFEIQSYLYRAQDNFNNNAIPTARLAQLTYNINRGENSSPLDCYSSFLPYPHRFLTIKQMSIVTGISKEAARDFNRYFNKLTHNQKVPFESIKLGLFELAKK